MHRNYSGLGYQHRSEISINSPSLKRLRDGLDTFLYVGGAHRFGRRDGSLRSSKVLVTKVESGVSTTEYTGFDILGRVTASKQRTDGTDYIASRSGTSNYARARREVMGMEARVREALRLTGGFAGGKVARGQ